MAEATDRPADRAATTASIPAAPPPPAGAADEAPRAYSSVSVVAIVGFVLSALYALVVGLGGLVALFNRTPWILPIWTLFLPVVAVAVCFAARARIRKAEGALTGARLATWGVGLAAVVGLLYAAYYGGCYFAVSSQAKKFTDDWMDLLKNGHIDQAFLYTLKSDGRPADDAGLRDRLEMDFDRGQGGQGGMLTGFRQGDLVRQFEEGGGAAKVEFLGVQGWGYDRGGYTVTLEYRIATPAMDSEMVVTAVGSDDANGDRQWYAQEPHPLKQPVFTEEGRRMQLWSGQAREFARDWLSKVEARDWDGAYLDTLPPAERDRQKKERGAPFDAGLKAFHDGVVVQFKPDDFWVGPKGAGKDEEHKKIQDAKAGVVRGLFAAGRTEAPQWALARALPEFHREGDLARLGFNIEITPAPPTGIVPADKAPLESDVFQARLVLTAAVGRGDPSKDEWRVESLDLLSAKSTAGAMPGLPRRPPPKQ